MRLMERKSVDGYMRDIRKKFKKGIVLEEILKGSDMTLFEEAKKANPELVMAAVKYIEYAQKQVKKGFVPAQEGLSEPACEERRALQKAFTCDTQAKVDLFKPKWFETGYNSFIYHLLEGVFDASLLVEQGAERKYRELVELYRTFYKVEESRSNYFAYYGNRVVFINTVRGQIYSLDSSGAKEKIKQSGIDRFERVDGRFGIEYMLVLKNGWKITLMRNGRLSDGWKREKLVKDHSKAYLKIIFQNAENGKPAVQFHVHIILLLAEYGLEPIKHTICKDSLITCDHLDMVGNNNRVSNLELVFRRDNALRGRCGSEEVKDMVYSYDLADFWKHIIKTFSIDKAEVKFQVNAIKDYWNEVLKNKSAYEILAA